MQPWTLDKVVMVLLSIAYWHQCFLGAPRFRVVFGTSDRKPTSLHPKLCSIAVYCTKSN